MTVKAYISKNKEWREELQLLHEIITASNLQENIKWGMPVYTWKQKNLVGFSAFKHWVAIWFYQGVFLRDKDSKLINAQEGTTKALRQWRFYSAAEIRENTALIRTYLDEAIQNQEAGRELKPVRKKSLSIPAELKDALEADAILEEKFRALSPGKQGEFVEYIGSAKRIETRQQRLSKVIPMIREGIGLNDCYKKQVTKKHSP